MRKLLHDFKTDKQQESWYDLRADWDLIESSIAKQYGIRLRQAKDMPWTEFCMLITGLMPDTPLGQIIAIRSETDKKTLKAFNPTQRKIRNDWLLKQSQEQLLDKDAYDKSMGQLADSLKKMFGKPKK